MSMKTFGSTPDQIVRQRRARVREMFEAGMKPKQMLEPVRREFGADVSLVAVYNDIRWLRTNTVGFPRRNGAINADEKNKAARWDDDMDRRCLALKQAGNSYGAIAEKLGVSRNAVAGRLYRLQQGKPTAMRHNAPTAKVTRPATRRPTRSRRSSPVPKRARPAGDAAVSATSSTCEEPTASPAPQKDTADGRDCDAEPICVAPVSEDNPWPPGAPTAVMTARPGTCRWPIGEPRAADFRFCGATALNGSSWCADHAACVWPDGGTGRGAS